MVSNSIETRWILTIIMGLIAMLIAGVVSFSISRSISLSEESLQRMRELQEANEQMRVVLETIPDGIAIVELETGMIVDCNIGFQELTGRTKRMLQGTLLLDLLPESLKNTWKAEYFDAPHDKWSTVLRAPSIDESAVFLRADGKVIPCSAMIKSLAVGSSKRWLIVAYPKEDSA